MTAASIAAFKPAAVVQPRYDWTRGEIAALFDRPLPDLLLKALQISAATSTDGRIQISRLLSIKTGSCAEDCGCRSPSTRFKAGLAVAKMMDVDAVLADARAAKANGADRFCMDAARCSLKDRGRRRANEMISAVKATGHETCVTPGMLDDGQAENQKDASLDDSNHNLDASHGYCENVASTCTYQDRIDTLNRARGAGLAPYCSSSLGMGESRADRVGLRHERSMIEPYSGSITIDALLPIAGMPPTKSDPISAVDLARAIAVARIVMPASCVRVSASRENMTEEGQALCLAAGTNSFVLGTRLPTTDNPNAYQDEVRLETRGIEWGPRTDKLQGNA